MAESTRPEDVVVVVVPESRAFDFYDRNTKKFIGWSSWTEVSALGEARTPEMILKILAVDSVGRDDLGEVRRTTEDKQILDDIRKILHRSNPFFETLPVTSR